MESRRSFLRNPRLHTLLVILAAIVGYLYLTRLAGQGIEALDILKTIFYIMILSPGEIPENMRLLFSHVGMLLFGTVLWLAFFAQFVLPVRKLSDRYRALDRLVIYMTGASGPTLFVENGVVHQRPGEMERKGKGVVILDTASAVLLRDNVKFTRVSGPGLVFTNKLEYIAGTVDLHRQVKPLPPLGPLGDEEPFKPKDISGKQESEELYEVRLKRRKETSGLTRDGVEVVPNVMALFRLEPKAGETRLAFHYNPDAVKRWITVEGRAIVGRRGEEAFQVPLEKLPAYLAVDVWREYLQKFTLSELFALPVPGDEGVETAQEIILRMVRLRLTESEVDELDNNGQLTGERVPSREYEILQDCGIQVDAVIISNLRFEPLVENKLVEDWITTWLTRSQFERNQVERGRGLRVHEGKQDALEWFAAAATRRLEPEFLDLPRPTEQQQANIQMGITLEKLVHGTMDGCRTDTNLYPRLVNELGQLGEIINWIRGQRP